MRKDLEKKLETIKKITDRIEELETELASELGVGVEEDEESEDEEEERDGSEIRPASTKRNGMTSKEIAEEMNLNITTVNGVFGAFNYAAYRKLLP